MKIRGLLAGLLVAVALTGCTSSATAPEIHSAPAAFDEAPPPAPDTTTAANRGGGAMGSGN